MLKRLNMFLWFCKRNLPSSTWAFGKELFNATVAQPFIIPFPHYRAFIYSLAQTSSKTSRSILCTSKQMGTLLCKSYTAIIHNIVPQERIIPRVMWRCKRKKRNWISWKVWTITVRCHAQHFVLFSCHVENAFPLCRWESKKESNLHERDVKREIIVLRSLTS